MIERRDFLKGLMGLVGVAVVGLPVVKDAELFDDIQQFLDKGGEPAHATGKFGSLRIDDQWYALNYASFTANMEIIPLEGNDSILATYSRILSANIECDIDGMLNLSPFAGGLLHEVEILVEGHEFTGKANLIWFGSGKDHSQMELSVIPPFHIIRTMT